MAKRLSERIAMQMQADARKISGHSRAVFLSLQEEIQEAVSDGWTLKAIWAILYKEGKVKFKYGMFRRYAQQILKKPRILPNGKISKEVAATRNADTVRHEIRKKESVKKTSSPKIENFEYDATPDMEKFK